MENVNIENQANYVEEIKELFKLDDQELFHDKFLEYHPFELAETLTQISQEDRLRVYKVFKPSEICDVFTHLEEEYIPEICDEINPKYVAKVLEEVNIDDAVDILGYLDDTERATYLKLMKKDTSAEIRKLLKYEEYTAGALMTTDYLEIDINFNVGQAMKHVIANAQDVEFLNTIYVTNSDDLLLGTLSLKELIIARKEELIKDILNDRLISVSPYTDQEEAAKLLRDYDFSSVPVVDRHNHMLGIITFDDIIDVIEEEAVEDFSKFAAISDADIVHDKETVFESVKKRVPWLTVLLGVGLISSFIIGQFESTLNEIPILAMFLPLIMGMAGNTGTQSLAVTVRAISSDQFEDKKDVYEHLFRELKIGIFNGMFLGLLIFAMVFLLMLTKSETMTYSIVDFAAVISVSVLLSLTIATLAGALIPLIMNLFKVDPAVASGPFITAVNDIIALSIYFTLATILINNLT